MQRWKATITYEIGMVYNNLKKFKEAEIMARKCLELNEKYNKGEEMEVLSLMLLSVIISSPKCAKYEESLDNLKRAKLIVNSKINNINLQTSNIDEKKNENENDENIENKNNIIKNNKNNKKNQTKQQTESLTKWKNHLTHINNLITKIIPIFIKDLKQKKNSQTPKNNNNKNKSNNNKNKKQKNKNKNKNKKPQNKKTESKNNKNNENESNSVIDKNLEMVD